MKPRLLLDTHVVLRWMTEPRKLSREQLRLLRDAIKRNEPLGISAITLMEIAMLTGPGSRRIDVAPAEFLEQFRPGSVFEILPVDVDVAIEISAIGRALKDPHDRAIVATARVHHMRLLTADVAILESGLASVVC